MRHPGGLGGSEIRDILKRESIGFSDRLDVACEGEKRQERF